MTSPPTGTVTFLFTDIEGSTHLWEQDSSQMSAALARHDAIMRAAIHANQGYIFKTMGDAFYAAFSTATDALAAALSAQTALHKESRPSTEGDQAPGIRVRMALHTGAAEERNGDYFGQPLNRVARLMAAGHGGQTLLSQSTYDLIRDHLPTGTELRDMGERRLRDLTQPEHIYQALVAGLPTEFPPLRTLDYRPNNLPRHTTSIVGREKEIAGLVALVRRPEVALVTLTGPGGTGKTRLALQVAAESLDDFPDGVWFVDLAPITDTRLVLPTVANVLSLNEIADQPIIEVLKNYLRDKQQLLVLDNFEQVIDASRDIAQLLSASPKLKIIATSRIPLRVRGEKEYPVSPLQLPDLKHLPSPDQLSQNASVSLFVERATDIKPDFRLNKENARPVAEICSRLDGLPLAIELAAARVRLLSPAMMLSRLQNRLKLLTGGARDLPARQQTIFNTIEWSYDLLDEGEKQFFRRIAVFQGGRTLEAMEAVCNFDGKLQMDVLDGVESLVSKNLLQQREDAEGTERFWMLETIHEFAVEKLEESAEANAVHREHALYFMNMAEEAEPHLEGIGWVGQVEWLVRLEIEHDNMRAALRWTRDNNEVEISFRLAGALWPFWNIHGYLSEGRKQLTGSLAMEGVDGPSAGTDMITDAVLRANAKVLTGAGILAWNQGDYVSTRLHFEQSLSRQRDLDDKTGIAFSLLRLGRVAQSQGEHGLAHSLFEEYLSVNRESGDKAGMADALMTLGIEAFIQGDFAEAKSLYEESLTLFLALGYKRGISAASFNLGQLMHREGDDERAKDLYEQSLTIGVELGDKRSIAVDLSALGGVAGKRGQMERGARLCAASAVLRETIGSVLEPEDRIEYDRDVAFIRSQLSELAFAKAWEEGRALSMEQAIAYALEDETATNRE